MNRHLHTGMAAAVMLAALLSACASTSTQRSTGQSVDDGVLTSKINAALIRNDQTKARQINVEVYKGEVQLNGFVDSAEAKAAASTATRSVEGVKSVQNNLQIRADRSAGQAIDDTVITARVKTALIGDSRTKASQIEVSTNAGVVQLGGFVDSAASKSVAAELARAVDGVKSVQNELQVKN
ncbi:MAG: BON domain-containing protein [Steroidobacteraceae bacterium]